MVNNCSTKLFLILKGVSDERHSWPISSANKISQKNLSSLMQKSAKFVCTEIVRFYCPTRTRSILNEKTPNLYAGTRRNTLSR